MKRWLKNFVFEFKLYLHGKMILLRQLTIITTKVQMIPTECFRRAWEFESMQ